MVSPVVLAVLILAAYWGTHLAAPTSALDRIRDRLHAWYEPSRTRVAPNGRLHITMRPPRGPGADRITEEIERRLGEHPAVTSATVDGSLGAVVITAPVTGMDSVTDDLLAIVEQIEQAHGVTSTNKATRTVLAALIACTRHIGWWTSGTLLATWLLATGQWDRAPLLVHAIEWAAVTGGQALLNRRDDTHPNPTTAA